MNSFICILKFALNILHLICKLSPNTTQSVHTIISTSAPSFFEYLQKIRAVTFKIFVVFNLALYTLYGVHIFIGIVKILIFGFSFALSSSKVRVLLAFQKIKQRKVNEAKFRDLDS